MLAQAAVVAALTLAWYDPLGTGRLTLFEVRPGLQQFDASGGGLGVGAEEAVKQRQSSVCLVHCAKFSV